MKYKQKEHIIEAVQWNGNNRAEISEALGMPEKELFYYKQLQVMHCGELVVVKPGDFVAKVAESTIMIYSEDHMKEYYEPVVGEGQEKIQITTPPRAGKTSRLERMFDPKENWDPGAKGERKVPESKEDITMEDVVKKLDEPKKNGGSKGYTGFLHLRCDSCGKARGMCAKRPLKAYRCVCGHETKLKGLKKAAFTCSCCGTHFEYMTNMTSLGFTMECLSCKAPVDLTYSQKNRRYTGGETDA